MYKLSLLCILFQKLKNKNFNDYYSFNSSILRNQRLYLFHKYLLSTHVYLQTQVGVWGFGVLGNAANQT